MSKTYKRTEKGYKTDWLPNIRSDDLTGINRYGHWFEPDQKAINWIEKNPHRLRDVNNWGWTNYAKSPSWWNHDFGTVPARAKTRNLLKKVLKGDIDADDITWPDYKKPVIYYW